MWKSRLVIQKWDGKGSLADFCGCANLDRRYLDSTQRVLLGEKLLPLYAAEAKQPRPPHARLP